LETRYPPCQANRWCVDAAYLWPLHAVPEGLHLLLLHWPHGPVALWHLKGPMAYHRLNAPVASLALWPYGIMGPMVLALASLASLGLWRYGITGQMGNSKGPAAHASPAPWGRHHPIPSFKWCPCPLIHTACVHVLRERGRGSHLCKGTTGAWPHAQASQPHAAPHLCLAARQRLGCVERSFPKCHKHLHLPT